MLDRSDAYKAAITGNPRRVGIRADIDLSDPDIVYPQVSSANLTPFSKTAELHDRIFELDTRYATLERGRWALDGAWPGAPESADGISGELGVESSAVSGADGVFSTPPRIPLYFSGVDVLQVCTVCFPTEDYNGWPVDFDVIIYSDSTAVYTATVHGSGERVFVISGFEVYNPDAIRVVVRQWSQPGRRVRMVEIVPGVYEQWTEDQIGALDVTQQADFAAVRLPYGTARLTFDNTSKRFDPRRADSLFKSLQARQGVGLSIGPILEGGVRELKSVGTYYQSPSGWGASDNALTMTWDLVDIIGLLVDRECRLPETLPETLEGWIALLVRQLGQSFAGKYHVDPDYAGQALTAAKSLAEGKKCGQLLQWVCQATGTWPRARSGDGFLTVEPLWNEGGALDLDNIESYPRLSANGDLAGITMTYYTGVLMTTENTLYLAGTNESAPDALSIGNPFLHSEEAALKCAQNILQFYGGLKIETTGRGDPAEEIGDVDSIALDVSEATTGRRMKQTLQYVDGLLRECDSAFLQASGWANYTERIEITASGSVTLPEGVTKCFVFLVGGGQGGGYGTDGRVVNTNLGGGNGNGVAGSDGAGAYVWYGEISVNSGQTFSVTIGAGGKAAGGPGVDGALGGETRMGPYSSASGHVYAYGYTDVRSGSIYGRSAVAVPVAPSGDGGKGGAAGSGGRSTTYVISTGEVWDGSSHPISDLETIVTVQATAGMPGADGAGGCVVICYDRDEVTA